MPTDLAARCTQCHTAVSPGDTYCTHCARTIAGALTVLPPDAARDEAVNAALLRENLAMLLGPQFVIEREIGRGGMGSVYAVYDKALKRRVAVKATLVADPDEEKAERFVREGQITAQLRHANIVSVYLPLSGHGVRAIVMELVEGCSVYALLGAKPTLPLICTAKVLADTAAALQYAHDHNVLHRDVKPANVLLGFDGRAMVADFGIARQIGATRLTALGVRLGTPLYMSPEVAAGENATAASDQYSFGIMAFEMLSGRRPFTGEQDKVLAEHMITPPPSLADMRPGLPQHVVDAVHRALRKDPSERWPSMRDLERVFQRVVTDREAATETLGRLSRAVAGVPVAAALAQADTVVGARAWRSRGMPSLVRTAAGIALALVMAAGGWRWFGAKGASRVVEQNGAVSTANVTPPPVAGVVRDKEPPSTPLDAPRRQSAPERTVAPQPVRQADDSTPVLASTSGAVSEQGLAVSAPAAGAYAAPPAPAAAPAAPPVSRGDTATARPSPPVALADARRLGSEFVTHINARRWRELEMLPATGGDSTARAALIRLVRSTDGVTAGFERLPAFPFSTGEGFESELLLDVAQTSGGRTRNTVYTITLSAKYSGSGWVLAGWRIEPARAAW